MHHNAVLILDVKAANKGDIQHTATECNLLQIHGNRICNQRVGGFKSLRQLQQIAPDCFPRMLRVPVRQHAKEQARLSEARFGSVSLANRVSCQTSLHPVGAVLADVSLANRKGADGEMLRGDKDVHRWPSG